MRYHRLPLLLAALVSLRAQDHGSIADKPYSTPQDRIAGMQTFRSTCAACHGLEGAGGSNGPSLTTGHFKHGDSDQALFQTITKGVPGTPMAAYPFDGKQTWQIIAYLRYLNLGKGAAPSKGDPANGARIFAANGCERCHTAGSAGGFLGPDLNQVGSRRTLAQLERAVLDPNAEVSPDYWTLRALTKSGRTVTGRRMNEDMDSFQILEASGRLRSLRKAELARYEILHTSPMPSFQGKLQPGELDDLVAYLASLRVEVR